MYFSLWPPLVPLFLLLFFGIVAAALIQSLIRWYRNSRAPRLTVNAAVVSKRIRVSHHTAGHHGRRTFTSYYVTFQLAGGERMELHVSGTEYGVLLEGDRGKLAYQGTRYLGFERLR